MTARRLQNAKSCFDKNVSGSLFCTYGGKDLRFDATYVPELRKYEVDSEKLSEFFDKLALLVQKAKRGHLPENKEVGKEAQGLFRKFEVRRGWMARIEKELSTTVASISCLTWITTPSPIRRLRPTQQR